MLARAFSLKGILDSAPCFQDHFSNGLCEMTKYIYSIKRD